MEEGGGLAPGEGGSHGDPGAAARQREAGDDGCLASNKGRGQGQDRGPLGPSGLRSQVGRGGVGFGWLVGQGQGSGWAS
jgi:hypothetical protein